MQAAAIREAMRQQPYVVAGGQPSNGQETGGGSNPAHEHYRRRLEAELLRLFATAAQGSPEAPALLRCAQALALGGVSANRGPPSAERSEQHEALLRYAIDASGHGHPGWLALLADEIGVDVAHTDVPVDDAPQSRMPALLYALVHGPDPLAAAEALKAHGVRPDREIEEAASAEGVDLGVLEHVFNGTEEQAPQPPSPQAGASDSGTESLASGAGPPAEETTAIGQPDQGPARPAIEGEAWLAHSLESAPGPPGEVAAMVVAPAPMPWAPLARAAAEAGSSDLPQRLRRAQVAMTTPSAVTAWRPRSRPLQMGPWAGHPPESWSSQNSDASEGTGAGEAAPHAQAHRTGAELWERLRVQTLSTRPAEDGKPPLGGPSPATAPQTTASSLTSNARLFAAMASAAKRPRIPMSNRVPVKTRAAASVPASNQRRLGGLDPILMKRYAAMLLRTTTHPPFPGPASAPEADPAGLPDAVRDTTPAAPGSLSRASLGERCESESADGASEGGPNGRLPLDRESTRDSDGDHDEHAQASAAVEASLPLFPTKGPSSDSPAPGDPHADFLAAMRVVQQVEAAATTLASASDQVFDYSSNLDTRWPRRGAPELRREPGLEAFEFSLPTDPDERDGVPTCTPGLRGLVGFAPEAARRLPDQQQLHRALLSSPIRQVRRNAAAPHRRGAGALGVSNASSRRYGFPVSQQ